MLPAFRSILHIRYYVKQPLKDHMRRAVSFFLSLLLSLFRYIFLVLSFSLFLLSGKCLELSKEQLHAGRAIVEEGGEKRRVFA